MTPKKLGNIIKKRRKSLGINQDEFCEIAGMAHHTQSNIESGKGNPTLLLLNKILDTLGMEIEIKVKEDKK